MTFVLSKILWPVLNPANVIWFFLIIGAVLSLFQRFQRLGRRVLLVSIAVLALATILPIRAWFIQPLENRFPAQPALPDRIAGIVVLSGAEAPSLTLARKAPQLGSEAERLIEFMRLGRSYPEARLIFSGGSGNLFGSDMAEADVAREVFKAVGFDWQRVVYEDRSRNTWENAVNARRLIEADQGNMPWVLVTSAAHMPRAVGAFRKAGWSVIPYPVDFTTTGQQGFTFRNNPFSGLSEWSHAAKEWIGLAAYFLMNQSDSVFPDPR